MQGLQVYRQLLRSASHAFKGDDFMLAAAKQEIRSKLEGSRQVTDAAQLEQLINEGKEAAAFLRTAIVQATANDKGHIEMEVKKEHTGSVAEPIAPGMTLPREKRKKKTE
ncbi:hypothetical protein Ndes2526B_g01595 [Nannochloris sp. 'desiccata']